MRRSRWRAAQAGVTLIELMVVVAIVGFLVAAAVITIRRDPTALDVAQQLSNQVAETSRKAVAGGAAASEFLDGSVAAPGAHERSFQARTRLRIVREGTRQVAEIERLTEASDTWERIGRHLISPNVEVVGYLPTAELSPGMSPNALPGDGFELRCYPDGSCLPELASPNALTLYLREVDRPESDARVVVMPLRGIPLVFSGW